MTALYLDTSAVLRTVLWAGGPLITHVGTAAMTLAGVAGLLWLRARHVRVEPAHD